MWRFREVVAGAVLLVGIAGCAHREAPLPEVRLWTHTGDTVEFPTHFAGSVVLLAFFYVQCPDICPMIAERMRQIWEALPDKHRVRGVMISFDPLRDTPERLREFAQVHELPLGEFVLATGKPEAVEALTRAVDVVVQKSPTEFADDGTPVYFYAHSDVLLLLDGRGRVVGRYSGTEAPVDRVVRDVQQLQKRLP
jgi:protein SCO1/2